MPIDNENPIDLRSGTLYMKVPDTGEVVCLGQCGPITGTIEADPADPIVAGQINMPKEATFTFNIPARKMNRKMNRKRFVKKLMGAKVPRNVANSMADIVWMHGHSYSFGYMVISASGYLPWED